MTQSNRLPEANLYPLLDSIISPSQRRVLFINPAATTFGDLFRTNTSQGIVFLRVSNATINKLVIYIINNHRRGYIYNSWAPPFECYNLLQYWIIHKLYSKFTLFPKAFCRLSNVGIALWNSRLAGHWGQSLSWDPSGWSVGWRASRVS